MVSDDTGTNDKQLENIHECKKTKDLGFAGFTKKHVVLPVAHRKSVASIGMDHSGVRMFTAGYDHNLKLWDKGLLFREDEEPFGTYPLRTIGFAMHSDKVLIVPHSPQPALVTREGRLMYAIGPHLILDMNFREETLTFWISVRPLGMLVRCVAERGIPPFLNAFLLDPLMGPFGFGMFSLVAVHL